MEPKPWKPQMRAGDREPVGGRLIEQASARRRRRLWIDVEDQRSVGPRHLDRREVNDIAPRPAGSDCATG